MGRIFNLFLCLPGARLRNEIKRRFGRKTGPELGERKIKGLCSVFFSCDRISIFLELLLSLSPSLSRVAASHHRSNYHRAKSEKLILRHIYFFFSWQPRSCNRTSKAVRLARTNQSEMKSGLYAHWISRKQRTNILIIKALLPICKADKLSRQLLTWSAWSVSSTSRATRLGWLDVLPPSLSLLSCHYTLSWPRKGEQTVWRKGRTLH